MPRLLTFQGRVEEKTSDADEQIAGEGHEEDRVMPVADTVANSTEGQADKKQIRHGVDDFGRVDGGIVVLEGSLVSKDGAVTVQTLQWQRASVADIPLHTS